MADWEWIGDREFDYVLCLHESGFGEQDGGLGDFRLLRKVRGLLARDGFFVLTTFNAMRRYRNLGPAFDHVTSTVRWEAPLSSGDTARSLIRVYTPSELGLLLSFSGFRIEKVYGAGRGDFRRDPSSPMTSR